jgi:hypothetical protein
MFLATFTADPSTAFLNADMSGYDKLDFTLKDSDKDLLLRKANPLIAAVMVWEIDHDPIIDDVRDPDGKWMSVL